jgi:hypothetical protein
VAAAHLRCRHPPTTEFFRPRCGLIHLRHGSQAFARFSLDSANAAIDRPRGPVEFLAARAQSSGICHGNSRVFTAAIHYCIRQTE